MLLNSNLSNGSKVNSGIGSGIMSKPIDKVIPGTEEATIII